jgi:hypothetical protein
LFDEKQITFYFRALMDWRSMAALVMLAPSAASAQAGPPMITNDPDTPGAGKWEINLAMTGGKRQSDWTVSAPDIDINRGVGENIQLSINLPWIHEHDSGGAWISGLGDVEFAIRWRFLDQDAAGLSMAVQPMWVSSWSRAAQRHGLASPNGEFVLPLQMARHFGHSAVGLEIARHFLESASDEWQMGAFVEHDCSEKSECLTEINTTWSSNDGPQTLVNVGARKSSVSI